MMYSNILSALKSNKIIWGIATSAITGYMVSKLILWNPFYALIVIIILSFICISLLLSKAGAKYMLFDRQLLLFLPLIFLYVTEIPKIGPLPLSPVFFFMGIYLLFSVANVADVFRDLILPHGKIFLLLVLCWFYQYLVSIIFADGSLLDMQIIEISGIFLGLRFFVKKSVERAVWATRILGGILIISMAWFVWEVSLGEPSSVRLLIYNSIFQNKEYSYSVTNPNGLSSLLFLFGYQIAVSVPLTLMLIFVEKRKRWKIFWVIGSVLSIFSMMYAGERSVLLAVVVVLVFFLCSRKRFRMATLIIFIAVILLLISLRVDIRQPTFERLQESEKRIEATERVKLQFGGLKVALNNPLGLSVAGKRWGDEARLAGADFGAWSGAEIAVHNGYLGRIIPYGWILGILMGLVLYRLLQAIRLIFSLLKTNIKGIQYALVVAFALISVLIQALFHNSSIFSFNATSVTIALLFLTWIDVLSSNNPEILRADRKR